MRSKNSAAITAIESAYLADVKRVPCVFCNASAPTEAHHPNGCQGLHLLAVSACPPCHSARVWTFGAMNELEASNETRRRVDELRATGRVTLREHHSRQHSARVPVKRSGSDLSSMKQLPRAV